MSSRLQLDMRNLSLGKRHLVNAYVIEAGIGVIAGNTVWSMPERLECEVLQKARYINTLTFTFTFLPTLPKITLSERKNDFLHDQENIWTRYFVQCRCPAQIPTFVRPRKFMTIIGSYITGCIVVSWANTHAARFVYIDNHIKPHEFTFTNVEYTLKFTNGRWNK